MKLLLKSTLSLLLFTSAPSAISGPNVLEPTLGRSIGIVCSSCHGTDGVSFGSMPTLKGLSYTTLEETLLSFRNDEREGTIMNRIAKGFTPEEITAVSDYYGSMR